MRSVRACRTACGTADGQGPANLLQELEKERTPWPTALAVIVEKVIGLGPEAGGLQHHTVHRDMLCRRRTSEGGRHAARPVGVDT